MAKQTNSDSKEGASPQVENGFTRIANELLEALARVRLSASETAIVLTVIRKTYGYHKTSDSIAGSQFSEATGVSRGNVWRTLSRLEKRNILTKVKPGGGRRATVWALQKDYTRWRGYKMASLAKSKESVNDISTEVTNDISTEVKCPRSDISTEAHKRKDIKKEKERGIPPGIKKSDREKTTSAFVKMFIPSIPGREAPYSDYPSETALDDIDCMAELWGDDVVQEAIRAAAQTGKSKLGPKYLESIIFRWKKERRIEPRITRREYDHYVQTR